MAALSVSKPTQVAKLSDILRTGIQTERPDADFLSLRDGPEQCYQPVWKEGFSNLFNMVTLTRSTQEAANIEVTIAYFAQSPMVAGLSRLRCLANLSASPFPVARTVARHSDLFSEDEQYAQQ